MQQLLLQAECPPDRADHELAVHRVAPPQILAVADTFVKEGFLRPETCGFGSVHAIGEMT
jgi:hypothetical protein